VFKAPAGIYSQIGIAKDVAYSMNAVDFDTVSNGKKALNIIRPIPGSGICVMGARTLSSTFSDKYIPTRRSLNYISANLKSLTQFAIFEPNDQNLWNEVNAVVTNFLDSFWRSGGLLGASSDQAYFVKCDATTNTSTAIANGEVRVEVGVALQRPAEFIIIKLGQINGGATITTSS
jgi:phage tail sheath protein FI